MSVIIQELMGSNYGVDEEGVRNASRNFLVSLGANSATGAPAIAAIPIVRYSSHPSDIGMFAQKAEARPWTDDSLSIYKVEYFYSSKIDTKDGEQNPLDPSNSDQTNLPPFRPWIISYGSESVTVPLGPQDKADPAVDVKASNGQPLTGIECQEDRLLINVEGYKYLGDINRIFHHQVYHNKINKNNFMFDGNLFSPKTVRVTRDDWTTVFESFYYWKFNITLSVKFDTWLLKVVDMGTFERISMGQPLRPIMIDGMPVKEPVPLDGFGMRLAPGDPLVLLTFQPYYEQDFLGLF